MCIRDRELAARDVKDLAGATAATPQPAPTQVNKLPGHRNPTASSSPSSPCYRCGGKHWAARCRFKTAKCNACGKVGHIAKVCRSKPRGSQRHQDRATHKVEDTSPAETPPAEEYTLYAVVSQRSPYPLRTTALLDGHKLVMEVDTGALYSLISKATFDKLWGADTAPPLQDVTILLRTYTGEPIGVLGSAMVSVQANNQELQLPLLVVEGDGPSLFGHNWLTKIRLSWKEIFSVRIQQTLENILEQHREVFKPELGTLNGVTAKLHIDPQAQPQFFKARTVPFALREKVECELERLEK